MKIIPALKFVIVFITCGGVSVADFRFKLAHITITFKQPLKWIRNDAGC